LIDGNIIRKICQTAHVSPEDHVLEIGPGPGALTEALLAAGARVTAIEKDRAFAQALARLQTPDSRLEVVHGDALKAPLAGGKVIANLPYHITTPLLERLLPRSDLFSTLTLMVQKEVAERMRAQAGTKEYSSFTLFLATYVEKITAFPVPRTCFYPSPRVDSAVVHLTLRTRPLSLPPRFFDAIHLAFQQRRKMLRSTLSQWPVATRLEELGLSPHARPEELTLSDWIALTAPWIDTELTSPPQPTDNRGVE
jgi:16S rRNA (adenine1518-N6/adenine1519-N6)-dimethyltransferase